MTTPSAASIPVNDANLLNGLSPYNWVSMDGFISSTIGGASIKVKFRRTRQVALQVETEHITTAATRFPILAWSVNGGPTQTHQLAAREKSVPLSTDVADPVIDFYLKGMSPLEDRFSGDVPPNAVKITGFSVDNDGETSPLAFPRSIWLNIGDSIMAGDGAAGAEGQGRPADDFWAASDDARASYGYLLAKHFGFRETRIAYGGYNWGGGGGNVPALTTLIDQKTSTVRRLSDRALSPSPAVALINLGENGIPAAAEVIHALERLRSRISPAAKVIVMIPVSTKGRTELTSAFNEYQATSKDENASLVDLGQLSFATVDGQHPTAGGHQAIYLEALPHLEAIVRQAKLD